MTEAGFFTVAGWAALLGGIWTLFERAETLASKPTRAAVAAWWQQFDPIASVSEWPHTFGQVFDGVFGQQHLSWRCFFRSCVASTGAIGIVMLLWGTHHPHALIQFVRSPVHRLSALALVTLLLSLLPDYLMLLQTRSVVRLMSRTLSARIVALLLIINVAATAASVSVLWYGLMFTIFSVFCADGFPFDCRRPAFEALRTFQEIVCFSEDLTFGVPGAIPVSVWFYASFLTSIWAILYAASWATVRAARLLGTGLRYWRRLVDIEEKPIRSLGLVAMLLTTAAYWVLMAVSMSLR